MVCEPPSWTRSQLLPSELRKISPLDSVLAYNLPSNSNRAQTDSLTPVSPGLTSSHDG